jgi:GNAT superfamily N-acetyltransferase
VKLINPLHIVEASQRDSAAIVAMIRSAFDASVLGLTVYGCQGVDLWVGERIADADVGRRFLCARLDGQLVGCIDHSMKEGVLFINYVAVEPGYRRRRIGSLLLEAATRAAEEARTLQLDVFMGNTPALTWYRSLGCLEAGRTRWLDASSSLPDQPFGEAFVLDHEVSEANQRAFGFSTMHIDIEGRTIGVGRLGKEWWRLVYPADLSPRTRKVLLGALVRLDPRRRLLIQTDDSWNGAIVLMEAMRLKGNLVDAREALSR